MWWGLEGAPPARFEVLTSSGWLDRLDGLLVVSTYLSS